jgi:hypothetical protein
MPLEARVEQAAEQVAYRLKDARAKRSAHACAVFRRLSHYLLEER